jgi:hypothetical protein
MDQVVEPRRARDGRELYTVNLRVVIPVTMHEWIRTEALMAGLSMGAFVRLILLAYRREEARAADATEV